MKILISLLLALSLNVNATIFDDIGGWFEGAYSDISYFVGHNPGISILGGLAVVSVTEPLALPWVALGTATPFILGYRVVGNEVLSSQAPKYISQSVTRAEMYEMGMTGVSQVPEELIVDNLTNMFEMGAGETIIKDGAGGTARTVLEDSAASAARKLAESTAEKNDWTIGRFLKNLKETPSKMLSRFGINGSEELEMDSLEFTSFDNPNYSFDAPSTSSAYDDFELQQIENQKILKYSPSDNLSPALEQEIDDMIAKAAYNESQKTFQQMSQKESLTLAKDMIELQSKELGFSGKWLKPAEDSIAGEIELADPFFTPDAYINPKSYPTRITFAENTTTTTLTGKAWRITSIGSFTAGAVLGFGYSTYKSIVDGVDWTKDTTRTLAGAANDTYCWLKNGGYMKCDGKIFTNITAKIPENKTDNNYFNDGAFIPMDGQEFVLDIDYVKG